MEAPYAIQAPGDSGLETPYTTWPFGSTGCVVADGKVYAPSTEHSPTLYYRGTKLHCIDAYTGDFVWSIMGYYDVNTIAEGTLFATSSYAFAKGETATTVSVQNDVYAKGSSILVKGSVLDLSPAQEGTAAISDACMSDWMEYLHMQQPMPMDVTGVQVSLDAVDPNGNFVHIGTATSDVSGLYSLLWEPEIEGKYTIIATFEGTESYYSSYAETAVGVAPAASASVSIEPTEPTAAAPLITTEVAIIAAVAIASVIGIVAYWALRKRK